MIVVPAGVIGTLSGGWVIKHFNMTIPTMLKTIICGTIIGVFGMGIFALHCPNPPFAGVTVGFSNRFVL